MHARSALRTSSRPCAARRATPQRCTKMGMATKGKPTPRPAPSSRPTKAESDQALLSAPACGWDFVGKDAAVGPVVIGACVAPRMFLANLDIIKNTGTCIQTLRVSPTEIDIHARGGEDFEKLALISARKLMQSLEFPHWREVHAAPGLGERLQRAMPTYTVREDSGGFVAAARLIAQAEREAALLELEKQVGMPLGTGNRGDPLTQKYLDTLKTTPLIKWPAWVRTVWPSAKDQAHKTKKV